MTVKTSEQALEGHINDMGKELGTLYNKLCTETAWIYIKWLECKELYFEKSKRVELLNLSASGFFAMLQTMLFEDITLSIARITDKPELGTKRNLTIQKLPDLISDFDTKREVKRKIEIALTNVEFARDRRNRYLAHRDLALALKNPNAKPLELATVDKIDNALKAIKEVLETTSRSHIVFESATRSHGALSLLHVLEHGIKRKENIKEKQKNGKYDRNDCSTKYL